MVGVVVVVAENDAFRNRFLWLFFVVVALLGGRWWCCFLRRIVGNNAEKELFKLLKEPFKLPNELLKFLVLVLVEPPPSSCEDFLWGFAVVVVVVAVAVADFLVLLWTCGEERARKLIIVWTTDFGAGGGSTLLNIIIVGRGSCGSNALLMSKC